MRRRTSDATVQLSTQWRASGWLVADRNDLKSLLKIYAFGFADGAVPIECVPFVFQSK
jgi:hypothetical protein